MPNQGRQINERTNMRAGELRIRGGESSKDDDDVQGDVPRRGWASLALSLSRSRKEGVYVYDAQVRSILVFT